MDFAERVGNSYQFVLERLKDSNGHKINSLTGLALEDVEYHTTIADVIVEHIYNVDAKYKVFAIYLIDSISKRNGGTEYRELFGLEIADLMYHVFSTGNADVRKMLYKVRDTWNSLFPAKILKEIDDKVQTIDSNWPYSAYRRKLIDEIAKVDKEIKDLRMELILMEARALVENQKTFAAEYDQQSLYQQAVQTKRKSPTVEMPAEKKLKSNFVSSISSGLLTPSPDQSDDSNDSNSFWSSMKVGNFASPTESTKLPFLFDSPTKCSGVNEMKPIDNTQPSEVSAQKTNINPQEVESIETKSLTASNEEKLFADDVTTKTQTYELNLSFENTLVFASTWYCK